MSFEADLYKDTAERHYHKNLLAVVAAVCAVVALLVGGYLLHTKLMLDAGYTWVPGQASQNGTSGSWTKAEAK